MTAWKVEFVEAAKAGVFENLSFGARPGGVTALLGEQGAGKTLALRMVCGLEHADTGAVIVGGIDAGHARGRALKRLRRGMSVMLQGGEESGHALFENATLHENLAFAMRAAGHVSAARVNGVATMYLGRFGLAHRAYDRPAQLSLHDRKRLAVARALALRAPLIVLDDLDGGLSRGARDELTAIVREECEDRAATYLVATRDADTARQVADEVVLLDGGFGLAPLERPGGLSQLHH